MFAIPTQVFQSNQWQLKSSLRQPMGVEAFVLEGVQIRTRLVSHLGQPILWTSTIHHLL
jgi:hypothetical protein